MFTPKLTLAGYAALLHVRPAQLTVFLKHVLQVKREDLSMSNGLRFHIDPVSTFGYELLSRSVYEPIMTKLLELSLGGSDVVFDVGANEGYFSVLAAYHVKAGTVYAIEPQSRLHAILKRNVEMNDFTERVRCMRTALSNSAGSLKLFLKPMTNSGGSGMFLTGRIPTGAIEVVNATTLDAIVSEERVRRIRLLKIDVEGAEHLVIGGAEATLRSRQVDIIALEYHPAVGPDPAKHYVQTHGDLLGYGYQLTEVRGQTIYYLPECKSVIDALHQWADAGGPDPH